MRECDLFGAVATTLAALAARLLAEEQALSEKANALEAKEGAIKALGIAVESRDAEVKGHTDRVTDLAIRVGEALALNTEGLEALRWGAYLHDLGKVATPDAILNKPGKLSPAEWTVMRQHVEAGYKVALPTAVFTSSNARDPSCTIMNAGTAAATRTVWQARKSPLSARIFSVCDVYDALISVRPYKNAWSHSDALQEIRSQAGRQFDPEVVAAFVRLCAGLKVADSPAT